MDNETEFSQLKRWEDVQLFADKVVAFKAIYKHVEEIKYPLSDPSLTYGFISSNVINWDSGNKGHAISLLFKKNAIGFTQALTNDYITGRGLEQHMLKNSLEMRVVNLQEAREICDVLNHDKGWLYPNRCTDEESTMSYLMDRLKELKTE